MRRIAVGLALVWMAGCRKDVARMDLDGDGLSAADGDCGPGDPLVGPDQVEVCDGRDNDCNDLVDDAVGTTWYSDGDGDGFGDDARPTLACMAPVGSVSYAGDCDDVNAAVHPGAREVCDDTSDFDCDGTPGGIDEDGDGTPACNDCDDADKDVHPGADELCGGVDENCDGLEDTGATNAKLYYVDLDDDGHGSDRITLSSCEAPAGFVEGSDDCDDLHAESYPGAAESCDGLDNDCDGTPDDGALGTRTWYGDADGDGYGDPTIDVRACAAPAGYVGNSDDCDDTDAKFNPAASESCTDPTDYNCDGAVGQADGDNDGTAACSDCDDSNAFVHPGAPEICDGLDNDCNGDIDEVAPTWYADVDGDTHGGKQLSVVSCVRPTGYVASSDDCNDLSATVLPGTIESCNGIDDDCVGGVPTNEADADGDLFRVCAKDCDDGSTATFPGATETCDGKDNDCDNLIDDAAVDAHATYTDGDGDGFGTGVASYACSVTAGRSAIAGDCDDATKGTFPGAIESCNSKDDDCDGFVDETGATGGTTYYLDADGDGVGSSKVSVTACATPAGYVATNTDCDDTDRQSYPLATELCDGVDNNCDKASVAGEADADKDGWRACGGDCDDTSALVAPGAAELCNSTDDDCDKSVDNNAVDAITWYLDNDKDSYGTSTNTKLQCTSAPTGYVAAAGDCDDTKIAVSPGVAELCSTVGDDDCDGVVNESDAADALPWFQDADSDKHGTPTNYTLACAQPAGRVLLNDDCKDTDATVYLDAPEVPGNGVDDDCNGADLVLRTCAQVAAIAPQAPSGVYTIDPDAAGARAPITTYCDLPSGWTLLARTDTRGGALSATERDTIRGTGTGANASFNMYGVTGYGSPATSSKIYWVPLNSWNDLTAAFPANQLRVQDSLYDLRLDDLTIGDATAEYPINWVGPVSGYSQVQQSAAVGAIKTMKFTTWDNDNDTYVNNCAKDNVGYNGGFWYTSCYQSSMLHANGNLYSWENNVTQTVTNISIWFHED